MSEFILNLELHLETSYQQQIREKLIELIQKDQFGNKPLLSSRKMAQLLGVSRNTVVLVYESLVDDGYLISRERSGFFVNPDIQQENVLVLDHPGAQAKATAPNWCDRLPRKPASFSTLEKDPNWMKYPFPFIYGQIEASQFPLYQWRDCSRHTQGRKAINEWVEDSIDADDSELVAQIRQQILSRRGISAANDEILITLGTQNSMSLLALLVSSEHTTIGVEDPGYADLRYTFYQAGARIKPLALDPQGLQVGAQLRGCDYVYVTPSHQYPTTVTMPLERRKQLLTQAAADDIVIIEDDYESEVNFIEDPIPALKSLDNSGRVIYLGSISKSLSPGLRIGYLVADRELIKQLRALRRLSYRHPPVNNQRTMALFLSQGYYASHVRRMRRVYEKKWHLMAAGLTRHLSCCNIVMTPGSFCFWVKLPGLLSSHALITAAAKHGILVEAGDRLFVAPTAANNYIRLGFSAIPETQIELGLAKLGELIDGLVHTSTTPFVHSHYYQPTAHQLN